MDKKNNVFKNIIFDLGGVLLNIDYQKSVEAFEHLGISSSDWTFTRETQAVLFQKFEKGLMTEKEFIDELKNLSSTLNLGFRFSQVLIYKFHFQSFSRLMREKKMQ